jgi:CheY-like chemotaxis protein
LYKVIEATMTKAISPKHVVLYADDDPDDLTLVKEAFDQYSNNVDMITASNGGEAFTQLKKLAENEHLPCLIILDVNMPVVDGKELLIKLRHMKEFSDTPVVLFTTSSSPVDIDFAKKYNAGFITKPLNMQQMEMITDQFIDHCSEEIRKKISKKLL